MKREGHRTVPSVALDGLDRRACAAAEYIELTRILAEIGAARDTDWRSGRVSAECRHPCAGFHPGGACPKAKEPDGSIAGRGRREPDLQAPEQVAAAIIEEEKMSLKQIAIIFGVVFVIVGACGWVPAVNPGGKLLGLFDVNPAHNFVHLATGIVAIIAGVSGEKGSRIFFQVFGVIYGLVAVLGFYYGDQPLLGIIANNRADSVLHVVIAIVALYLGFGMKPATIPTT